MKVRAIREAWYNKQKIEVGRIVEYEGDELPVWGTLAEGAVYEDTTNNNHNNNEVNVTLNGNAVISDGETVENQQDNSQTEESNEGGLPPVNTPTENSDDKNKSEQSEEDLSLKLETLKDIAAENDVWVDIPAELTQEEEYKLLCDALVQKGITINI